MGLIRAICKIEGCENLAASKGLRDGKRRYSTRCHKHLGKYQQPYQLLYRKSKRAAKVYCIKRRCRRCHQPFSSKALVQVFCRECSSILSRQRAKLKQAKPYNGVRLKFCRNCAEPLGKGRRNRMYCSPKCKMAAYSRRSGVQPRSIQPSYYARHRPPLPRRQVLPRDYRQKMSVKKLSDNYVKQVLVSELKVPRSLIPSDILDLKRNQLRLYRTIHRKGGVKYIPQKSAAPQPIQSINWNAAK